MNETVNGLARSAGCQGLGVGFWVKMKTDGSAPLFEILNQKRTEMREAVNHFRTANLRVFGSAMLGNDKEGSDLDLLVDALPGATLIDLGGLQVELEEILGVPVDLLTPGDLPLKFRDQVLRQASPL